MAAYPEYPWQISKFVDARNPPYGFWQEDRNILSFFPRIEEKLGIQQVNSILLPPLSGNDV